MEQTILYPISFSSYSDMDSKYNFQMFMHNRTKNKIHYYVHQNQWKSKSISKIANKEILKKGRIQLSKIIEKMNNIIERCVWK